MLVFYTGVFAIVAGSHAAAVRRERVIKRHGVLKTVHNPHLHVYASTLGLSEDSWFDGHQPCAVCTVVVVVDLSEPRCAPAFIQRSLKHALHRLHIFSAHRAGQRCVALDVWSCTHATQAFVTAW